MLAFELLNVMLKKIKTDNEMFIMNSFTSMRILTLVMQSLVFILYFRATPT